MKESTNCIAFVRFLNVFTEAKTFVECLDMKYFTVPVCNVGCKGKICLFTLLCPLMHKIL